MRFLLSVLLVAAATSVEAASKSTLRARLQQQVKAEASVQAKGDDTPYFPLKSANSFECATVHFNHKENQHELVQKGCQGSGADGQMFMIREDRQVESKQEAGSCLTVLRGRKAAGNKVTLTPCDAEDFHEQYSRLEFMPNIRGMHQISFVSKNWTFYCFGINDFDHNVRIYGCDAHHPYQMWKFDANQYILLPRCNNGDFPEEQVRCGDMVYLYQANSKSVSYVREVKGDDNNIGSYGELNARKAWEVVCLTGEVGDRMFSGQNFCLQQNHRYLQLDAQNHWGQNKYCGGYHNDLLSQHDKVPLDQNEQNMVAISSDDDKNAGHHASAKDAIMYACRSNDGFMRNHISITGVVNGQNADPQVWMKIGADQKVSTSTSLKHAETRIYLLPPGY